MAVKTPAAPAPRVVDRAPPAAAAAPPAPLGDTLDDFADQVKSSPITAWALVLGLPFVLGLLTTLLGLPLLAAPVVVVFGVLAVWATIRPLLEAASWAAALIVGGRAVLILALAAALIFTTGQVWMGLVTIVLLWLVADRLLCRSVIRDTLDLLKIRRANRVAAQQRAAWRAEATAQQAAWAAQGGPPAAGDSQP